jgi:hypothetical protein
MQSAPADRRIASGSQTIPPTTAAPSRELDAPARRDRIVRVRKRAPQKLESLENLIQQAEHYAVWMMAGVSGMVPPTLMALTPEGFVMHVPSRNSTEQDKDRLAKVMRLIAAAYKATAVVTILESWIVVPKRRGQEVDLSVPPSQSPDREEVVVIAGECREGATTRFLFIQRDGLGKFAGFGTSLLPQDGKLEGRFAGLIPPKEPTNEMAATAKNLLQAMGVSVEQVGFDPRWN